MDMSTDDVENVESNYDHDPSSDHVPEKGPHGTNDPDKPPDATEPHNCSSKRVRSRKKSSDDGSRESQHPNGADVTNGNTTVPVGNTPSAHDAQVNELSLSAAERQRRKHDKHYLIRLMGSRRDGVTVAEMYDVSRDCPVAQRTVPHTIVEHVLKHLLREVSILQYLRHHGGHPNLISAEDMYYNLENEGDINAFSVHVVTPLMQCNLQRFLTNLECFGTAPTHSRGTYLREVAVRVTFQMLLGLDYLHSAGIVHRDLKPQNVLMNISRDCANTVVRLADFALARDAAPPDGSGIFTPVGDENYWSPERMIARDLPSVDTKMDIWSLGCVLYALITERSLLRSCAHLNGCPVGNSAGRKLHQIIEVIGRPTDTEIESMNESPMKVFLRRVDPCEPTLRSLLDRKLLSSLEYFDEDLSEEKEQWVNLIGSCLKFFPSQRPTAAQLLNHPLFHRYGLALGDTVHQKPAPPEKWCSPVKRGSVVERKSQLRTLIESF